MAVHSEIATWADLLKVLQSLTPQQLDTPAQVVRSHPVYEHVHEAEPIVFMGTVDEQSTLPFGTPEQVRTEVLERLRTVGRGGGFILAPTHHVQLDTPIENLLAMVETAKSTPMASLR